MVGGGGRLRRSDGRCCKLAACSPKHLARRMPEPRNSFQVTGKESFALQKLQHDLRRSLTQSACIMKTLPWQVKASSASNSRQAKAALMAAGSSCGPKSAAAAKIRGRWSAGVMMLTVSRAQKVRHGGASFTLPLRGDFDNGKIMGG